MNVDMVYGFFIGLGIGYILMVINNRVFQSILYNKGKNKEVEYFKGEPFVIIGEREYFEKLREIPNR